MNTKKILILLAILAASLVAFAKGLQPVAWRFDHHDLVIEDEAVRNKGVASISIDSENKAYDGDNGYIEFTIKDASKAKWIGFYNKDNGNVYGFFFSSGNYQALSIIDDNIWRPAPLPVSSGDRFEITLSGSSVTLSLNGGAPLKTFSIGSRGGTVYCARMRLSAGASFSGVKTTIAIPYSWGPEGDNSGYNIVHSIQPQVAVSSISSGGERHTGKFIENVTYTDGIGRTAKTVSFFASPVLNHLHHNREYDEYGREPVTYLPYTRKRGTEVSVPSDWKDEQASFLREYYPGDGNYGYTETRYDNSPLNRVTAEVGSGADWKGADGSAEDAVRYEYTSNSSDIMLIKITEASPTAKFYLSGEHLRHTLSIARTIDENGNKYEKYTNGDGLTVMERKYAGTSYPESTYYVYDEMGNLRLVLQPEAAYALETEFGGGKSFSWTYDIPDDLIYQQGFYYEYDKKGRVTQKQVPSVASESSGKVTGNVKMVYSKRDQLVLYQDGKLEEDGSWRYYIYDRFGREVISGIYSSTASQSVLQDEVNSSYWTITSSGTTYGYNTSYCFPNPDNLPSGSVETVTYYDDYSFPGHSASFTLPGGFTGTKAARNRGLVTAVKQKVLGTDTYLITEYCYDKYGRVLQSVSDNIAGGKDIVTTEYDFTGRPLKTLTQSTASQGSFTYLERYEYDHAGRLINTYGTANGGEEILVSHNSYDQTGKLKETNFHDTKDHGPIQSVDYRYNIRGWLTDINDTEDEDCDEIDLFSMKLCYNDPSIVTANSSDQQHNGNISAIEWKTGDDPNAYSYLYQYGCGTSNGSGLLYAFMHKNREPQGLYNNCYFRYSRNGNIKYRSIYNNSTGIDQLNYEYEGNRLLAVGDNRSAFDVNRGDFFEHGEFEGIPVDNNGETIEEYTYDLAGNMTEDKNRGITIEYNSLNLPKKVTLVNPVTEEVNYIEYAYDALGNKLKVSVDGKTVAYYCGNVVYDENGFDYAMVSGARVVDNNIGGLRYEYTLADHQGNTRAVYADRDGDAEILQKEAYYPFGMRIPSFSYDPNGTEDKYLYNGKELEERIAGFHFYDYGARFYDPALARWHSADPLADLFPTYTPYHYVHNNPVNLIDPTGMYADEWNYNIATGDMTWQSDLGGSEVQFVNFVSPHENGAMQWHGTYSFEGPSFYYGPTSNGFGVGSVNYWSGLSDNLYGYRGYRYDMDDLVMRYNILNGDSHHLKMGLLDFERQGWAEPLTADNYWNTYGHTLGNMILMEAYIPAGVKLAEGAQGGGSGHSPSTANVKYLPSSTSGKLTTKDVVSNPGLLKLRSLSNVKNQLKDTEGWKTGVLNKGRSAGKGWTLHQMNSRGNEPTDKYIQYHPGTHRHFGGDPYWKVSSGKPGIQKFRATK